MLNVAETKGNSTNRLFNDLANIETVLQQAGVDIYDHPEP